MCPVELLQRHLPGLRHEEYRKMLGQFGVGVDQLHLLRLSCIVCYWVILMEKNCLCKCLLLEVGGSPATQQIATLSGGQKARVAVAVLASTY